MGTISHPEDNSVGGLKKYFDFHIEGRWDCKDQASHVSGHCHTKYLQGACKGLLGAGQERQNEYELSPKKNVLVGSFSQFIFIKIYLDFENFI